MVGREANVEPVSLAAEGDGSGKPVFATSRRTFTARLPVCGKKRERRTSACPATPTELAAFGGRPPATQHLARRRSFCAACRRA